MEEVNGKRDGFFKSLLSRFFKKKVDNVVKNLDKKKDKNIIDLLNFDKRKFIIHNDFIGRMYSKYVNGQQGLKSKVYEYESMYRDPILSMALEFIVDDSTQYSKMTKKRIWVVCKNVKLNCVIDDLFSGLDLQNRIWYICGLLALYGTIFLRIYYRNGDFTGGISNIEIERDLFRYIPVEVNGVIIKFIDGYKKELLEPFEVLVLKINMLNDNVLLDSFYDVEIKSDIENNKYKVTSSSSFCYGTSFFENCRRVWKQRLLVEDSLILCRLENAPKIRMFKVNVNGLSAEASNDLINYYTDLLTYSNKVISEAENVIRGSDTQLNFNTKIVLPVNENEGLTVEDFGGDADISGIEDLERLDKIFYASLRVPPDFLGLGENTGINIGENSLIRQEIRYARTCKKLQFSVINGIKDLVYYNFLSLGLDVDYENDYDVVMNIISTAEEEEEKKALENSFGIINSFFDFLNSLKELIMGDSGYSEDDLVKLSYFVVNDLLNINDINWDEIIKHLIDNKKKGVGGEGGGEEEGGGFGDLFGGGEAGEAGGAGVEKSSAGGAGVELGENEVSEESVGGGESVEGVAENKVESVGRRIDRLKFFEGASRVYNSLDSKLKNSIFNLFINKFSKKDVVPRFSFNNELRYIRDNFVGGVGSRRVIVESFNRERLSLNEGNLRKIIGECSKFDLKIFKDCDNFGDFDISKMSYLSEDRVRSVDLRDVYFGESVVLVSDLVSSYYDDVCLYEIDGKYYLNYINECKLLRGILDGNNLKDVIFSVKKFK